VDRDLARRLAELPALNPARQHALWALEDRFIQQALAHRDDLLEPLQELCASSLELIPSWARKVQRAEHLLALAAQTLHAAGGAESGTLAEHAAMSLAVQRELPASARAQLCATASPMSAWVLLNRTDLSEAELLQLVRMHLTNDANGNFVRRCLTGEMLSSDLRFTIAVVQCANVDQLPLLMSAAEHWGHEPRMQAHLVAAVRTIAATWREDLDITATGLGPAKPTMQRSVLRRLVERILRRADLPAHLIVELMALPPAFRPPVEELTWRLTSDVAAQLAAVGCTIEEPCTQPDREQHVELVNYLLSHWDRVELPQTRMVSSALVHFDSLTSEAVRALHEHCTTGALRALAQQCADLSDWHSLLNLVSVTGLGVLDSVSNPTPALRMLAEQGHPELHRSRHLEQWVEPIVHNFAPLKALVQDLNYLRVIMADIESAPDGVAQIMLHLLPDWLGTLDELRRTAQSLHR
jgi:hypothetical protein